jgi:riboflavin kinase / FMN adenylyltransferase
VSGALCAYHGVERVPADLGPTVVTMGVFDGVHRGHRALLDRVVRAAAERGVPPGAVTFDRHPVEVLAPGRAPPRLTTLRRKVALLGEVGMRFVLVLRFTRRLSLTSAETFATDVLFGALGARAVLVGADFHFGHKAAGDVALLARLGRPRGIDVVGVPLLGDGGEAISSTRVRAELAGGDVEAAARSLGRPYELRGDVVHGEGRGRALGVPTANLALPARMALPDSGVYAGHLDPGGEPLPALVSVGTKPQFGGSRLEVEAHVLDFDGDLYGRRVALSFEHRVRGTQARFDSVDALVARMHEDIRIGRRLLGVPAGTRARRD